jgi:ABC-type Fe3+-hydroxamate transport system substrate-binding protein
MDPLMTIHGETFISDVLDLAGGFNIFADRTRRYPLAADVGNAVAWSAERVGSRDVRYPRVTLDEVVARQPDVVLLPDEPHPFSEEDAAIFRALPIPAAHNGRVLRVSGRELCWYSLRMTTALAEVARWLA